MLVVDGSGSQFYGSSEHLKQDIIAQVASCLAIIADSCKDFVGMILFEDEIKTFLPAKRGRKHIHILIERVFSHEASGRTCLKKALERLIIMNRKDMVVFLFYDFIDSDYEKILKIVCRKYETVALRCLDKREWSFPSVGLVTMIDAETGEQAVVQTKSGVLNEIVQDQERLTRETLKRCGAELLDIEVERPFVGQLVQFFRQRMLY